uniref:Uncharacterized protein n=1 Tax=Arundo donax TaxID=35708 RepID=A0A0A9AZS0_ARUDO
MAFMQINHHISLLFSQATMSYFPHLRSMTCTQTCYFRNIIAAQ